MRFLRDESAEYSIGPWLKDRGHDVTAIGQEYPPSLIDRDVLAIAYAESRVLVTNDSDFGDLVWHRGQPHAGVNYFRMAGLSIETKLERLSSVLSDYADELDQFIVVTASDVRVRRAGDEP